MRTKAIGVAAFYVLAALAIPLRSSAGPQFLTYEGRNAVHEGQGGEKKVVSGIDFWMTGDPPRRFQVLGSLADRRHQSGLIGMVRMSALDDDIAKAARAAGGDAVILESEDSDVIGGSNYVSTTGDGYNAFSVAGTHLIRKHDSRWAVVKYLTVDAPGTAAAVASPAAPTPTP